MTCTGSSGTIAMSRGRDMNRLYLAGTPTIELETEQHGRVQQRTAWQALQSGLSTSRAQELALDTRERGRQRPLERWSVPELHAEIRRLEAVVSLTPPDRTADIRHAEQRVAAARSDVQRASEYRDALEGRKRPLMERLRGPDEQLLHANTTVDGHQTRLFGLEYELHAARDGQRRRIDYLAAHPDAPATVRRIKEIVADRVDLAVANDMIETPEYLRELIGDYRSAPDKKRWLEAAAKVEGHRMEHGIDDRLLAFGERPPSWADALRWDQQVEAVVDLVKPEHERAKERQRGISMSM